LVQAAHFLVETLFNVQMKKLFEDRQISNEVVPCCWPVALFLHADPHTHTHTHAHALHVTGCRSALQEHQAKLILKVLLRFLASLQRPDEAAPLVVEAAKDVAPILQSWDTMLALLQQENATGSQEGEDNAEADEISGCLGRTPRPRTAWPLTIT
jgi:hypothetical protein